MRRSLFAFLVVLAALALTACGTSVTVNIDQAPEQETASQPEEAGAEEQVVSTEEALEQVPTEETPEEAIITEAPTEETEEPEAQEEEITAEEAPAEEEAPVESEEEEPESGAAEPVKINLVPDTSMTLSDGWQAVYALEVGVPFELTVSEEQLEAAFVEYGDFPNASNFNIHLDNGLITITCTVQLEAVTRDATIVLVPSIEDGHLILTVQSATFGRLTLPDEIVAEISTVLQEAMLGAREEIAAEYGVKAELISIEVDDGEMTIAGTVVPA